MRERLIETLTERDDGTSVAMGSCLIGTGVGATTVHHSAYLWRTSWMQNRVQTSIPIA